MSESSPSHHPGQPDWSPSSWRQKPVVQMPAYADPDRLSAVVEELSKLPPLVTSWEVESLRSQLAEAAQGRAFLLQGGDCSEIFSECESAIIANKLKILLQMSLILIHAGKRRVIRVGRFAGQYAKPRSSDQESRDGVTLPTYRGDLINQVEFSETTRQPDPELLLRGYERAALTLNFIRSLSDSGFADLHHTEYWELGFVAHSPQASHYQKIVHSIGESLRFFETLAGSKVGDIRRVDFYTSHEGLHLNYEEAQTRLIPRVGKWFDLSTHFPWIGERTREAGGAHVEYFRGISNPIGVKVGPDCTASQLLELVRVLDPDREPGRVTLIHRLGLKQIEKVLPELIQAVQQEDRKVLWCCDPMHGNTRSTSSGYKTRDFKEILGELERAFQIHHDLGSYLGGVHFELTGDDVTECVGGARGLTEADLGRAYKTRVDPRLNYEQALEMALLIGEQMQKHFPAGADQTS